MTSPFLFKMKFLRSITLSASGRPVLSEDEVELHLVDAVHVLDQHKSKVMSATAIVTSHQIFLLATEAKHSLPLSSVHSVKFKGASFISYAQLKIHINVDGQTETQSLYFKFTQGGDVFSSKVESSLKKKAWQIQSVKPSAPEQPAFSTYQAGIAGIVRKEEKKLQETDRALDQAFTDLSSLIEKAKEMVQVAERLASSIAKDAQSENDELQAAIFNIGIISPVTKQSAGAAYHRELARQLSDFLEHPIKQLGGMITLPDAFCLFNRARGTALITTDDMHQACGLLAQMNLPIVPRKFDTGVQVLQSRDHDDESSSKDLAQLISKRGTYSAFQMAQEQRISVLVAKEKLLCAERMQYLCRDESPDGITFYPNLFPSLKI